MAFKEATKMTEREAMVQKWESGNYTVTELAQEFGVTRPTVYLWLERSITDGSMEDRPSTPLTCPHRTGVEITQRIVEAKLTRPHWGPRKLIDKLKLDEPGTVWPAPSTAGRLLEARNLVKKRHRRRKIDNIRHAATTLGADESGEMMTIDH